MRNDSSGCINRKGTASYSSTMKYKDYIAMLIGDICCMYNDNTCASLSVCLRNKLNMSQIRAHIFMTKSC